MANNVSILPRPRIPMPTSGALRTIVCISAYVIGVLFLLVIGIFCVAYKLKLTLLQILGVKLDVLSGLDAVFCHVCRSWFVDPICQQVVPIALVVKGHPVVAKLRALLQERLVAATGSSSGNRRFHRFTQHIVRKFGYFVWEDDEKFTMDHRVTLWTGYTNDASLMDQLQKIFERPFAKGHSPWEVVLLPKIPEVDVEDEYVFLLRYFHGLGDGVQMLRILESLFGRSGHQGSSSNTYYDDVHQYLPVDKMPAQFRYNPFLRYLRNPGATTSNEDRIAILINGLKTAFMIPWHMMEAVLHKTDSSSPYKLHAPLAVLTGRKLLSRTARIDLQRFKTVAGAHGCTINDVYLHCLTGAYQSCNAQTVQEVPSAQEVPSKRRDAASAQDRPTYAKMIIPINLLPESVIWGENCFANLLLTLPSSGTDSTDRLLEIAQICHSVKSSTDASGQLLFTHALGNHLPSFIAEFVFMDVLDLELALTNVRGPEAGATLCGDPVTDMFLVANNFSNAAVSFSFISYNGGARIVVNVDRLAAPDDGIAQRLADNFVEELNNLVEHAIRKKTI